MEIQTNPEFSINTPKVKCIASHPKYEYIVVGHFNGELSIYSPENLALKKTNKITEGAIRAVVIMHSADLIIAGTDDGELVVIDSGSFQVIKRLPAHEDFIRKIVLDENNNRFLTTSDDNTVKLWEVRSGDFKILNIYKDSKHYVMDAAFDIVDSTMFFTGSLDGKIRQYSIFHTKRINTIYNKNYVKLIGGVKRSTLTGINALSFINKDCYATGNDDGIVDVFDRQRGILVNSFQAHLGQINSINSITFNNKGYFITTSSDNSVKILDEFYKSVDVKYFSCKAWDACEHQGFIFVGTDEQLISYKIIQENSFFILNSNKIFYSESGKLKMCKTSELSHSREIGNFNGNICISENSKLISITNNSNTTIYSVLGMRNKLEIKNSNDCLFIGNDSFYILNSKEFKIIKYIKMEKNEEILIKFSDNDLLIEKILWGDLNSFVLQCKEYSLFYKNGNFEKIPFCNNIAKINNCFILINSKFLQIFNIDKNEINDNKINNEIISYTVIDDSVIFYSTSNRTYYGILINGELKIYNYTFLPNIIGNSENEIFYTEKGKKNILKHLIDKNFIDFQINVFNKKPVEINENLKSKAIAFYESLEMHQEALNICSNDNQRFEILIKLNKFSEAFSIASSPAKFIKLGQAYLKKGNLSKAAECFYKGNDIKSLFLADVFGDKKYLEFVAQKAKDSGEMNLAVLAYFKNQKYEQCSELLKDTVFYNLFRNNFCSKK